MTDAAYDVFISYARVDADEARAIRDKLTALDLRVFFDTEGIDTGEEFPVIIDRAVKNAKCVLGLWSRRAFDGRGDFCEQSPKLPRSPARWDGNRPGSILPRPQNATRRPCSQVLPAAPQRRSG